MHYRRILLIFNMCVRSFLRGLLRCGGHDERRISELSLLQKVVRNNIFRKKRLLPDSKSIENPVFALIHYQMPLLPFNI